MNPLLLAFVVADRKRLVDSGLACASYLSGKCGWTREMRSTVSSELHTKLTVSNARACSDCVRLIHQEAASYARCSIYQVSYVSVFPAKCNPVYLRVP